MGTSQLAADVLEELAGHHEIAGVFTRPDAVRGRGKKLVASPVKVEALELGVKVFTPSTLKSPEAIESVSSLQPDMICVVSYGCLLPSEILQIPTHGCLNVHTSLLPRWRGAAPIERAILAGDANTGVCIMRMDEGLDTGPVCLRRTVEIGGLYLDELTRLLAQTGSRALVEAIDSIENQTVTWTDQAGDGVTYAHKVEKGELACEPADTADRIAAKVRASSDSRPAKITLAGRTLALERVKLVSPDAFKEEGFLHAGEASLMAKKLVIGADDGMVSLERVKPDGKKSMDGSAFAAGIQGLKGTRVKWEKI